MHTKKPTANIIFNGKILETSPWRLGSIFPLTIPFQRYAWRSGQCNEMGKGNKKYTDLDDTVKLSLVVDDIVILKTYKHK